ncbi:MAG: hypothetical protein IJ206_00600 [Oscillospiraceae bacterium]|nr:hypothetical protein [Oscillospiraceae bacterium]
MKERLLAILLACVMLLSLTACGGAQPGSAAPAEEAASAPAEEAAPAEETVSTEAAAAPAEESVPADSAEASAEEEVAEETPDYPAYELGADGEVTYTGSLIPSWEGKGVSSSFILGLRVAGGEITGNLPELAAEDGGAVTVSEGAVSSELGDALNDASATNTGFLAVVGTEADTDVTLRDADLTFSDNSDGKNANDFTALGTVVVATGGADTKTTLTMDNVHIETDGFGRDAVVVDAYANAVMRNSSIVTHGANPLTEAYEGYASTAAQAYMISPPWILGIYGGVRAANVLGNSSSFTVVDSTIESGSWAVISTDDCTNPTVNVVNSTLKVTEYDGSDKTGNDSSDSMNGGAALFGYEKNYGSGYGTYNIGSSYENFYGTTFDGTTYTTILTGAGPTYYGPSAEGMILVNEATGEEVGTFEGEARDTVVNSVFGVMDHQGASQVTLDKGSVWNTEEAVILVRGAQNSTFTVSGAEMNPASGVLFQQMDDDDGYGTSGGGGDTSGDQGFYKWDGSAWGMPTFSSGFSDPNEAGFVAPTAGGSYNTTLNLEIGDGPGRGGPVTYTGDIFNGTGTGSGTTPGGLLVNIGSKVTLEGAISATSAVHGLPYTAEAAAYLDELAEKYGDGIAPNGGEACTVKYVLLDAEGNVTEDADKAENIQITEFTMNEYYIISHVINKAMEGANILVTVEDGATWKVTKDCYITGLMNNGTIEIADGATLYVDGEPYDGKSAEAGNLSAGEGGGSVDTTDWVVGQNYRTQCAGKYADITIDDGLYYYVGASSIVTGVAIVNVAFDFQGWLVVADDGSYSISEEYVELDTSAMMGGMGGPGGPGGPPPDGIGGPPPMP